MAGRGRRMADDRMGRRRGEDGEYLYLMIRIRWGGLGRATVWWGGGGGANV